MAFMYRKPRETLFNLLKPFDDLPNSVDKKPMIRPILAGWRNYELLKRVLASETSFERTFTPLAEAYQAGGCYNDPEFVTLAQKIGEMFQGIVDLSFFDCWAAVVITPVMLMEYVTAPMEPVSRLRKWFMSRYGIFEPKRLRKRRECAERILEDCQVLDRVVNSFIR